METTGEKITFWSASRAAAIGLCSMVSLLIFFAATQERTGDEAIAVATLAALFTLVWLGLLAPAARISGRRTAEQALLGVVALAMLALIAGVFVGGWISEEGALLAWLVFPILMLIVVVRARVQSRVRQRQATAVLTHVEQAVRLNLPLPEMLAAAAIGESTAVAARLGAVREGIAEGMPLEIALAAGAPEFPPELIQYLGFAQRTGRFPQALRNLLARRQVLQSNEVPEPGIFYEAYPLAGLVAVATVVALICVTIIPKFKSLMQDFHLALPTSTLLLLRWAGDPILALGFSGLCLFILAYCLATIFFGRLTWFAWTREIRHEILWWIPLLRAYVRELGLADLCRSIAGAAGHGVPIQEVIAQSAQAQSSAAVARRAGEWARQLAGGQSLGDSAAAAGMPRLIRGMVSTVRDETGLAAVMSFLANYYDYRFARARAIVRAAYVPIVVLLLGGMVALVALAIFQPMEELIRATSHFVGGF